MWISIEEDKAKEMPHKVVEERGEFQKSQICNSKLLHVLRWVVFAVLEAKTNLTYGYLGVSRFGLKLA